MKGGPPAVAVALALTLAACGSGGGSADSNPAPQVVETGGAGPRVAPLRVSGGGSAQLRVKGADNSIQNYGSEARPEELRRAAAALHGYFAALATEAWARACADLSRRELAMLGHLAASSAELKDAGCPRTLAKLIGKVGAAAAHEATVVDAVSLRRKGPQAFLIYRGAGGKPYFSSMTPQRDGWAVAAITPTPLP
jgi:hypothetical protein